MDTPTSIPPMPEPDASSRSRADRAAAARLERERRHQLAKRLAQPYEGLATRSMLHAAGLTRGQVRSQIEHGAWRAVGRHTLDVTGVELTGRAAWWLALWESGRSAALDGISALQAAGLTGWDEPVVHVSVANGAHVRPLVGVRHHRPRILGRVIESELRRTAPEVAVLRAAQWARSDQAAATVVAMAVQQRLLPGAALMECWGQVQASKRRGLLTEVIGDVCDGAHSLSELDFARLCRARGLPGPTRQALRTGAGGRVYLDVLWEELGVHVEIQGAHHNQGLAGVEDALRSNNLQIDNDVKVTLHIPVLGLRLRPDAFLDQVERAINAAIGRPAA
ncbi:MAG: hypothetical protein Q4F65_00045 [Propionibacteriaceae bacterium]|nr:hypothetical protein [Propionibacteriaceae bacterium]